MANIETCLESVIGAAARKAERDRLIRRAALMLPVNEPYAQAGLLAKEAKAMARTWNISSRLHAIESPATPRECLSAARQIAELPNSQRQFHRVLTKRQH